MNPILSKLLALLSPPRRMEYLVVDGDLKILDSSWEVQRFAEFPDRVFKGNDVRLAFPEIVGFEDILSDLMKGSRANFELKGIARFLDQSHPLYIDICIVADQDERMQNRLIILFEDVTEKMVFQQNLVQRANETSLLASALEEHKRYVDQIIAAMTEALLITTNSGRIKKINLAAAALFGYEEWELINHPITTIIKDEKFFYLEKSLKLENTVFKNVEFTCHTKDRGKINVEFSCSLIETDIENFPDFMYVGRERRDR